MKMVRQSVPLSRLLRRWDGGTVSLIPYVISRFPKRERAQPEDVSRHPTTPK